MKTKDHIQADALKAIRNLQRSGVEISMGVGKTRIGLKHMAVNYTYIARYLVVAPKKSIFTSWNDEMEENNFGYLQNHTDFSTYRSLTKQDLDYDIVYLDECHSLKASHNEWLKKYVARGGIIVGLTGTYPVQKTTEKGKMCNYYCPKVYEYSVDDAVGDNILNDYEIIVHEMNLSEKPTIIKEGKHGEWKTSEMKEYIYWTNRLESAYPGKDEQICRIQRMKKLQSFDSKEMYAKLLLEEQTHKAIVFANTQNQADRLCSHSFHSKNKDSEDNLALFKGGQLTKLSAVEQLSEGVTVPKLKVGIIMHSYSNNRKAAQKIGRLLRLNPDDKATVHILCYSNSVDKEWVINALSEFNQDKIKWVKGKYYAGVHY
jgi:superfamily II DNA or RNA helicase